MATVVTSKFTPFTFEELLKPALMATQAHYEMEDAYTELATKANVWESLANSEQDKDVYNMYKAYSDDLKKQADILASQGLNANSRKALSQMKARYSSEINPIEKADIARKKQIEEQRKLSADPTAIISRKASETSLKDYIDNPTLDYEYQSGSLITKRVADEVKNYAKNIVRAGDWKSTASGQILERAVTTGLTRNDINSILSNPNAFPEIQQLINNVVETTGIQNWGDKQALEDAYIYAREGLFAGLGTTTIDTEKDASYMNPYQQWKWEKEKEEYDKSKKEEVDTNNVSDMFFKWIGTETSIDESKDGKELGYLSEQLNKYKEAVEAGITPKHIEENILSVPDPLTGKVSYTGRTKKIKDPRLEAYEKLTEKYGTSDINELEKLLNVDIKKKVSQTRGVMLNRGASKLMMGDLRTTLLAGIDNWSDAKEVKKRIYKQSDKSAPDEDTLIKIFNDDTADVVYYPSSNTFKIVSEYGNYIINNTAAFNNIKMPIPGMENADNYFKTISDAFLSSKGSKEDIVGLNNLLSLGFATLNEYYNTFIPEASATSSKANISSVK